jgi:hypothetical protein
MDENTQESAVGLLPPPDKDDKLFGPDEDWQSNACVNWSHNPQNLYNNGYRTAAQSLVEQVCESRYSVDSLVYPIVYLYRHHTELMLKGITVVSRSLLDQDLTEKDNELLNQHKLFELWQNIRPALNLVCEAIGNPLFPDEELDGIESYVAQINEQDPDGQRFRYATYRKYVKTQEGGKTIKIITREKSLQPELSHINIRRFGAYMERLSDYLDSIESWFSHMLQEKWEYESWETKEVAYYEAQYEAI